MLIAYPCNSEIGAVKKGVGGTAEMS
ncbi:rCG52337 [Rattus norvegicus]|uniref:RCG52337 n=1 Tax=Rattus norvegicus TaxID=10116 RepID=A6K0T9_RAT|nr:rCG52337 [Rattus norvegicus]